MKKIMLGASAAVLGGSVFAETTAPTITLTDAMTNCLTPIQTALTSFLPTVVPVVAAIAGLGLVFFLAKWGIGLVKSFMKKSAS